MQECRVGGKKYQMKEVLSFCVLTSFNKDNNASFSGEKKNVMKLSGVSIFWEYAKKLKLNLAFVVALSVLVLESKDL